MLLLLLLNCAGRDAGAAEDDDERAGALGRGAAVAVRRAEMEEGGGCLRWSARWW